MIVTSAHWIGPRGRKLLQQHVAHRAAAESVLWKQESAPLGIGEALVRQDVAALSPIKAAGEGLWIDTRVGPDRCEDRFLPKLYAAHLQSSAHLPLGK